MVISGHGAPQPVGESGVDPVVEALYRPRAGGGSQQRIPIPTSSWCRMARRDAKDRKEQQLVVEFATSSKPPCCFCSKINDSTNDELQWDMNLFQEVPARAPYVSATLQTSSDPQSRNESQVLLVLTESVSIIFSNDLKLT
ncbi:hypothetical protein ACLKA6_000992 [Drosophila palustris]